MAALLNYKKQLDRATKFIPDWVKVAVALALGLGTMVGWKRIVVTVGERIGKQHLTYAQGASAELIAMGTILAADRFGLPVSTTHVLTSGVAGTMAESAPVFNGQQSARLLPLGFLRFRCRSRSQPDSSGHFVMCFSCLLPRYRKYHEFRTDIGHMAAEKRRAASGV